MDKEEAAQQVPHLKNASLWVPVTPKGKGKVKQG